MIVCFFLTIKALVIAFIFMVNFWIYTPTEIWPISPKVTEIHYRRTEKKEINNTLHSVPVLRAEQNGDTGYSARGTESEMTKN